MTSKQLLLALGELDDNTVSDAREPMRRGIRRPLRTALIAAAALILCVTAVWGAKATINSQRARFAKTREDAWQNGLEENMVCMFSDYHTDEFPKRTAEEWIANRAATTKEDLAWSGQQTSCNGGLSYREKNGELVETGASYSWDLIAHAEAMPSLSAMGQYQDLYHPDVSYVESTLVPVEDSFIYWTESGSGIVNTSEHDTEYKPEQLFSVQLSGCYRLPSGGAFELMFDYYPAMPVGSPWFIGDNIILRDIVKSADGTEFDLVQFDNWIIAHASFIHGDIIIYGIDATVDEVVDQITHLDLNDVPAVFSTGNE